MVRAVQTAPKLVKLVSVVQVIVNSRNHDVSPVLSGRIAGGGAESKTPN